MPKGPIKVDMCDDGRSECVKDCYGDRECKMSCINGYKYCVMSCGGQKE